MRKINYPLIVTDFDGTLADDGQQIPESVRAAIKEYVSCGGGFTVCTGRMLKSILPIVRSLGLSGLTVAYQGTVIADIGTGKIVKNGGLSPMQCREIGLYLEELKANINAYSGDELYTNMPQGDKHIALYEKITGVTANHVGGKMSDFLSKNSLTCQKFACLVSPQERRELYLKLVSKFGDKYDVTCSASVLVEISPYGDDKGAALKFISDYYKVPLSRTVAAGDNLNDLSMIKAAGVGVAVGNAVDELKAAADFVSVTNNEGAIAQIIEKYGFA